jgi:hypothetical protein
MDFKKPFPYCFFDPPLMLDCAITHIPGNSGAPLQVIADSGPYFGSGMTFEDQTGTLIGVYIGPTGQEIFQFTIGNGENGYKAKGIPKHARISLRSMNPSAIVGGLLAAALVTQGGNA